MAFATIRMYPKSDQLAGWPTQVPASGSHYDKVDEDPTPDDASTYVYGSTVAAVIDRYGLTGTLPPTSTVATVRLVVRGFCNTSAVTGRITPRIYLGGTKYGHGTIDVSYNVWTTYSTIIGGRSWATADFTSSTSSGAMIDLAASFSGPGRSLQVRNTQCYLLVTYSVPSGDITGTIRLANTIDNFEKTVTKRLAQIAAVMPERQERLAQELSGDKELYSRVANIVRFPSATIRLYPLRDGYDGKFTAPSYWDKLDSRWPLTDTTSSIYHSTLKTIATFDVIHTPLTNTVPKSCGFDQAGLYFYAKKDSAGHKTAVKAKVKIPGEGTWRYQTGTTALTTSWAWHTPTLQDFFDSGAASKLHGVKFGLEKGYIHPISSNATNADSCRVAEIHFVTRLFYDTQPPATPGTLILSGKLLRNFATVKTSVVPSLGLWYIDSTNATYGDYDESSVVHWIIGTGVTGGTITSQVLNKQVDVIGSVNSYVVIDWPIPTPLDTDTLYYCQARVRDANRNWSGWSAIASFSNVGEESWWNNNWTRRQKILYGDNHSELPYGYTVDFPFNTGVYKTAGTQAHIGEAVQGSCIFRRKDRTYLTWRSQVENQGRIYVRYYDHTLNQFSSKVFVGTTSFSDSHYYPVISVTPTGWVLLAIGGHHTTIRLFRSTATYSLTFNSTADATFPRGTYPGVSYSNGGTCYFWYRMSSPTYSIGPRYRVYYKSFDEGATWPSLYYYVNYTDIVTWPDQGGPSPDTSMSAVSVYGDMDYNKSTGKFYSYLVFNDSYGGQQSGYNFSKGISLVWSNDAIVWYNLDNTIAGTSSLDFPSSQNIQYGKLQTIVNNSNYPASTVGPFYSGVGGGGGWDINAHSILPSGSIWVGIYGVMRNSSGSGTVKLFYNTVASTWASIQIVNSSTEIKSWGPRQHGGIQQTYDYQNNVVLNYSAAAYPTDETWFGAEMILRSSNNIYNGNSYGLVYLTKNSAYGVPLSVLAPSLYNNQLEQILVRNREIHYWNGSQPGTLFLFSGDDLRVVYGTQELDRVPKNYFNHEDSIINYRIQATVPENSQTDQKRMYYLYYGNYFAAATNPREPNNVYITHDGMETYSIGSFPTRWRLSGTTSNSYVTAYNFDVYSGAFSTWDSIAVSQLYAGNKVYRVQHVTSVSGSMSRSVFMPDIAVYKGNYFEFEISMYVNSGGKITKDGYVTLKSSKLNTPEVANGTFNNWVTTNLPNAWVPSGTITQSATAYNGSYSAALFQGDSTKAVLLSSSFAVATNHKFSTTFKWRTTWSGTEIIAGKNYFDVYVLNKNYSTIASRHFIGAVLNNSIWRSGTLFATPTTENIYVKFVAPTYAANDGNILIDNVTCTLSEKYDFFSFGFTNFTPTPQFRTSTSTAWDQSQALYNYSGIQYNTFKVIYGTQSKGYINDKLAATSSLYWNKVPSTLSINYQTPQFIDQFILRGWVENPPSPIATAEFIKDFRSVSRLAQFAEVAYIRSKRLAQEVETDKEVIDRLANIILGEYTAAQRIAQILIGEKTNTERLAQFLSGDKILSERIAQLISFDKVTFQRLAQVANPEKQITDRLAQMLTSDKESINRLSQIILGDKEDTIRLAQIGAPDKALTDRIAEIVLGDKELVTRIAEIVTMDKESAAELAQIVSGDKELTSLLANVISSDKTLLSKLAQIVFGDKEVVSRIAQIASVDHELAVRLAQIVNLDKELSDRLAQIVFGDKEVTDRLAQIISIDKTLINRLAQEIALDKTLITRLAQTLISDKEIALRLAQTISGDKEVFIRLAQIIVGDKPASVRLAQYLSADKEGVKKLANILNSDKETLSRLAQFVDLGGARLARLAQELNLDKESTNRLAQILQGEISAVVRLAQEISTDKELTARVAQFIMLDQTGTERLAQFIETDKTLTLRLAMEVSFEKSVTNRLSQILSGDKELENRLANTLFGDKELLSRYANIVNSEKILTLRIANIAFLGGSSEIRLAQIASLDKEVATRIAQEISGDKASIIRLAQTVFLNKEVISRLAQIATPVREAYQRLANLLSSDKETIYRLAMEVNGDKEFAFRLAQNLTLGTTLVLRLANILFGDKSITARLANVLSFPIAYPDLILAENFELLRSYIANKVLFDSSVKNIELI